MSNISSITFLFHLQIVVVFYVAIVLLLIGTNLRANRAGRSARFKKHVVEYSEGSGKAENKLVPAGGHIQRSNSMTSEGNAFEYEEEEVAEV